MKTAHFSNVEPLKKLTLLSRERKKSQTCWETARISYWTLTYFLHRVTYCSHFAIFALSLFLSLSIYKVERYEIYTLFIPFYFFAKHLRVNHRDQSPKPLITLHIPPKKKDILLHNHRSKIKICGINVTLIAPTPFYSNVYSPAVQDASQHHAWHVDNKFRAFCSVLELCGI